MNEIYERYLESHFIRANIPSREAFEYMARCYFNWYDPYLPKNKDARILDFGCGMGHFLYFLNKMGYSNFIGIDISPQQVAFVRKYITNNVILADGFDFLKEAIRRREHFDIIVLNDVIEHIPKVKILELLKLILNTLKPGGKVFIKTPNMGNPFNLRSRYMDFSHEVGFTEHSLYEVLYTAGFRKIHIFGAREPCGRGIKAGIMRLMNSSFHNVMRSIFRILLIPPPKILDKNIIAIGEKPSE
jgi:2-polyprenyl-3-methyl-5-hydroxy-6-metoxy-1,4-benzoquinol methylase